MRDPFEKQGDAARHIKICVSGPVSAGKTCFGLDAKNYGFGPVALLSLESGEVQFRDSQRWGGFKPLQTQSLAEMKEAIEFLEANPGKYGTLVVDTITGIYEAVVDAKMKDDGSMNRNTWGLVKRAWKSLMLRLVNLPLHVVFVVHENEIVEEDAKGNFKVVGHKLDTEKRFERAPDFWLRLVMGADKKPIGTVMKVRGESTGFSVGQKISEPHLGMFAKAIKTGEAEARVAPPEEVARANEAAMATGPAEVAAVRSLPELITPEQRVAMDSLKAALAEGFKAQAHKDNWLKKHRPEIAALPEWAKSELRDMFDAASIGAKEQSA